MLARLGKGTKLVLGLLTLWPLIYLFLFIGFMMLMVFSSMNDPVMSDGPDAIFGTVFMFHILTMLLTFGLVVLYVVDVFKSTVIEQDKRVMWLIVILLAGMIAMPIYWYLYIWRSPASTQGPGGQVRW